MRKVFFSFHYQQDSWRVSNVRESWRSHPDRDSAGYVDAARWESIERQGESAIRNWIDGAMSGTSVTVVLIGAQTSNRKWVRYELQRSVDEGKGVVGIYIHNIRNQLSQTSQKGNTDFGTLIDPRTGEGFQFSQRFSAYDWVNNNGRANIGSWVERAAQSVGR
jgi:hypothetical protein